MVISAGLGSVISGGLSTGGGLLSNVLSMGQSRKNRKFQHYMSSTAYRRAVQDMRLAGINPMLAAKVGGASSPGGSQPNITNPLEGAANSALTYAEKVNKQKLDLQNLQNLRANERQVNAAARKTDAEIKILKENLVQAKSNSAKAQISERAWRAAGEPAISAIDAIANTDIPPVSDVLEGLWSSAKEQYGKFADTYGKSSRKPLELTITPAQASRAKNELRRKLSQQRKIR